MLILWRTLYILGSFSAFILFIAREDNLPPLATVVVGLTLAVAVFLIGNGLECWIK